MSPRVAVDQWLNSPGHRTNLFRRQWRVVGIALRRSADVERFDDAMALYDRQAELRRTWSMHGWRTIDPFDDISEDDKVIWVNQFGDR